MVERQQLYKQWERESRHRRNEFLDRINSQKLVPLVFDLSKQRDKRSYERIQNQRTDQWPDIVDNRVGDLATLYKRFHPGPNQNSFHESGWPTRTFLNWLKERDLISVTSGFDERGVRLVLPVGLDKNGKVIRQVFAYNPPDIHSEIMEASAWNLIDKKTRRKLKNVDAIFVGASVGSNIAVVLGKMGVENFTIVDYDTHDGVVATRAGDVRETQGGMNKAVRVKQVLLESNPNITCEVYTRPLTEKNSKEILQGVMRRTKGKRVVIFEEADSMEAKRELREEARRLYGDSDIELVIISLADVGLLANKMIVEEPSDPPYFGQGLKYSEDPFARTGILDQEHSGVPIFNILGQIFATYGLITENVKDPTSKDLNIPPELVIALNDLLDGKIGSFEQSPLASRLAGILGVQTFISWLQGNLHGQSFYVNLAAQLDERFQNPKFIKEQQKKILKLQKRIGMVTSQKKN